MSCADADWPEDLLVHRMCSEETAQTCLERRKARQQRFEKLLTETLGIDPTQQPQSHATTSNDGPNPTQSSAVVNFDQNDSVSSAGDLGPTESVENTDGGDGGVGLAGGIDADAYSKILGGAKDAAGLLEWKQQVLFRGMRVRMSVATGYVDNVRVHSMTKRREYTGDVLKKVQAVGEAPHGGQVGRVGTGWVGAGLNWVGRSQKDCLFFGWLG